MQIVKIEENKKQYLDLLLLADEQEEMIDRYLERGDMFALSVNGQIISVCVVTRESNDVCELKNIATDEKWHGKGYGSKLLNHIFTYYRGRYTTMLVGIGDASWILQFYQNNGLQYRIR